MKGGVRPVAELLLQLLDLGPLLVGELALLDVGREVVEPALAALLGLAVDHVGGNEGPVLGAVLGHQVAQELVLSVRPVLGAAVAKRG